MSTNKLCYFCLLSYATLSLNYISNWPFFCGRLFTIRHDLRIKWWYNTIIVNSEIFTSTIKIFCMCDKQNAFITYTIIAITKIIGIFPSIIHFYKHQKNEKKSELPCLLEKRHNNVLRTAQKSHKKDCLKVPTKKFPMPTFSVH